MYAMYVGLISNKEQTLTAISDKSCELMYAAQKGNTPIDLSQCVLAPWGNTKDKHEYFFVLERKVITLYKFYKSLASKSCLYFTSSVSTALH